MFVVKCTLPNASEMISGVPFSLQSDGSMATDEIDQETASRFTGINGYTILDASTDPALVERDALWAEILALGGTIDKRLSVANLQVQLQKLQAAATAKAQTEADAAKLAADTAAAEAAAKAAQTSNA